MNSKTLIEACMAAKNHTQYKQMAADLGFTSGYFAEINQGRKEVTEETAAYIAREAGLDEQEVLLKLARAKAKSETTQTEWDKLLQQYGNGLHAALFLTFMLLINGIFNFA